VLRQNERKGLGAAAYLLDVDETYAEALSAELDTIAAAYVDVLGRSSVKYVNPNRGDRGIIFVGAPDWGWATSDSELEGARMALMRRLRDWTPRFRLLFTHPTPEVAKRLDNGIDHLERWLMRDDSWDHTVPSTIEDAQGKIRATVDDLRDLTNLLPPDDYPVRLVVDTNALIDNPDLAYSDVVENLPVHTDIGPAHRV
jgi:hypothetical protein